MKTIRAFQVFWTVLALAGRTYVFAQQECVKRDYGNGGHVCVCTSKRCDTIPNLQKLDEGKYLTFTSNKEGLRFHKKSGSFGRSSSKNALKINPKRQFQKIVGFGGAFTDSVGINLKSVDDDLQSTLLKSYFSNEGIGYTLCRVPIGSTDFSTRRYTYDDVENDIELTNFKLAEEDLQYKIPFMQKARQLTGDSLRFFASVWTAPIWMKSVENYDGGKLKPEMYQPWANYILKFFESYDQAGLKFYGFATQNEPSVPYITNDDISTIEWLPRALSVWVRNNLGPTMKQSKFSDVKIFVLDDQKVFLAGYLRRFLENNETMQYVEGVAFHWYIPVPGFMLTETHQMYPGLTLLSTEASYITGPILGSWDHGEQYSNDIMQDLQNWVTGWIDWNIILDEQGGPSYIENFLDACIIVNSSAGEFYRNPMFYHIGHFSKFIPVDSVRIESSGNMPRGIEAVAFETPDKARVLVVLNTNEEPESIAIADSARGSAKLDLSEKSITTVVYW